MCKVRVRPFRYIGDPLFLGAVALYLANRLWLKPMVSGPGGFLHAYLNDVLCIPFWLPPVLLVHRILGLRGHDRPPTLAEIVLHLGLWAFLFEFHLVRFPGLFPLAVADPWDVAAYAAGAALAALCWGSGLEREPGRCGVVP